MVERHPFGFRTTFDRRNHFHVRKCRDEEIDDRLVVDKSFDEDVRHLRGTFALLGSNMDRLVVNGFLLHFET